MTRLNRALGALSVASLTLLSGCTNQPAAGPDPDLSRALRQMSTALEHFVDRGETPSFDQLSQESGLSDEELKRWTIDIDINADVGYCVEGDDHRGTWHMTRDDDGPVEGDCPNS